MGGGYGGRLRDREIERLAEVARERLGAASGDGKRHVFISFANEDLNDVNMLRGQAKNQSSELEFDDLSLREPFDSKNVEYIKNGIRERIDRASVTVVFLSPESAKSKWVDWEVTESLSRGKGVVGVYKGDRQPDELPPAFQAGGCKAVRWTHEGLAKAIEDASRKR